MIENNPQSQLNPSPAYQNSSSDAHTKLLRVIAICILLIGLFTFFNHKFSFLAKLPFFSQDLDKDVLAAYDLVPYTQLQSNLKYVFNNSADVLNGMTIRGDVDADGSNVTLGEGTIIASNIIYSLIAGDGITISPGQNPIISLATPAETIVGVSSIENITGDIDLVAGSNISLSTDGNQITINASGSSTDTDTDTTYSAGEGLALNNTTFSVDFNGVGLPDIGNSNTTSGASIIGVYSGNFANIAVSTPGTDLQTVLEAIDDELSVMGGGGIAAVGNITSGPAFTLGVPGSNLFIADTGWVGIGANAGRIWFDDNTTDTISFLNANVGIGTTSPSYTLDVAGNIRAGTDIYIGSTGLTTTSGASVLGVDSSTIIYSSANNLQQVLQDLDTAINNFGVGGSGVWLDGGSYAYLNPALTTYLGNSTSGGTNKLSGAYFSDNSLLAFGTDNDFRMLFDGTNFILGDTSNTFLSIGDSGTTGNFNFNNGQMYVRGDGNVGIGTTNPSEMLDIVNGNIRLNSGALYWHYNQRKISEEMSGGQVIRFSNSMTSDGGNAFGGFEFMDSHNSNVVMKITEGKVGIGMASPEYALDVVGSGTNVFRASGLGGAHILHVQDSGVGPGHVFIGGSANADSAIRLSTNSTNFMINSLSIGRTNPTANMKLDVVGNIRAGTDVYIGNIALGGTGTSNATSGASRIGTYDEFTYSNATTVQNVLDDLDAALVTIASGTSVAWRDGGSFLFPTSGEYLGNMAVGGTGKLTGVYFSDNSLISLGTDNDFRMLFNGTNFILGDTSNTFLSIGDSGTTGNFNFNNNQMYIRGDGNVGIGTTSPAYTLDVVGNIRALNFINDDGSPVNDILMPQEIQNVSINALKGSVGMDVLGWQTNVAPTVFESGNTRHISATTLTNGNVLIAYNDGDNSSYGTYMIISQTGSVVVSPTVFESANTSDISATTLINGNVLISYRDQGNSSYGTYTIINPTGTVVMGPTVFYTASAFDTSATTLTNGNVLIAYRSAGLGIYTIISPIGSVVVSPTVFENGSAQHISATTLTNGNVLIAYRNSSNNGYGTYTIISPTGSVVVSPTVFESASTSNISATTLTNGNVLIAYVDIDNSSYGTYTIISPTGSVVVSPTVFESATTWFISVMALTNGDVLIAYTDQGGGYYGTYTIISPTGSVVVSPTVFESANAYYVSATTLTNGNVLIAYQDVDNSGYGTFTILEGSGARFAQNLSVDGNVGINHTSPGSKLAIGGLGSNTGTNLVIDADGNVWRDSSSLRYKEDVTPFITEFSKIYELDAVKYRFKGTDNYTIGYVAEDLHALGLTDLVVYDNEGRPDAIKYDRLSLYNLELLKEQKGNIDGLSSVLSASTSSFNTQDTRILGIQDEVAEQKEQITSMQDQIDQLFDIVHDSNKIASEESKITNLSDRVSFLEQMLFGTEASSSAELAELINNTNNYPDGEVLGIEDGKLVLEDLTVTGKTNLFNLGVVGDMSVGQIVVRGNESEINSLALPLQIQSEATASIQFMAGKVVIDTDGNITVEKEVTAKKYNVDTKDKEAPSIGKGSIKVGETEVIIKTKSVTNTSNIFLTATIETDVPLAVVEKIAGNSFKVKIVKEAEEEISFNWWIVN